MKIFTIESETNNITVHTSAKEAEAVAGAERFRNEAGLAKLAADWPAARLVEIWNSLPGATPVKKFKDRGTAVSRIWSAIQNLGQPAPAEKGRDLVATAILVAPQTPDVAPPAAPLAKKTTLAKKTPKSATKGAREGSKTETVVELLKRPGGVTLTELMNTTGWQAHSVRGFIAGTAKKKLGLTIVSNKGADGERVYSVEA